MSAESHSAQLKAAERILVPVDLSPISYQALDLALRLAGPVSRVRLFFACPPVYGYLTEAGGSDMPAVQVRDPQLSALQLAQARKDLLRYAESLGDRIEAETVESGQAAHSIVEAARRFGADLVVMTTHGRGGFSRLLSGSVAQELFRLYYGPIVLLRPERRNEGA